MKKRITLFALFFAIGMTNAQQKPTQEETINFIKNKVDSFEGNFSKFSSAAGGYTSSLNFSSTIRFEGCALIIERKRLHTVITVEKGKVVDDVTTLTISFNLKDIESVENINVSPHPLSFEEGTLYCIQFNTKDGAKLIEEDNVRKGLSYGGTTLDESNSEQVSSTYIYVNEQDRDKLIQAFNHLRKLCGAPDPIKFD